MQDDEQQRHQQEQEEEEEQPATQPARVAKPLQTPTPDQRQQHNATHLPFQQWCSVCVRARAKEAPHFQKPASTSEPPVLQLDYQYVKLFDHEHVATLLIGAVD